MGDSVRATSTIGCEATSATGAKSFSVSKAIFGYSAGLMAKVDVCGSNAARVCTTCPAPLASGGIVTGARPPVANRWGSSNRSCGRVIGAKGRPTDSKRRASSAAARPPRRWRGSGIIQSRARTRSLLLASRVSASRSAKPNSRHSSAHCVSLTRARKICSPPATVKTS